jgi:hypothetical protein
MKILNQTDRLLQIRQNNWLPWYWQLLMWPTVGILLLMSFSGSESKLTCQRSKGQCQLEGQSAKGAVKKTIPLAEIKNIDLKASNEAEVDSNAHLVLVGQSETTVVGDDHSYDDMDDIANKLGWFLGNQSAEFIEISESTVWLSRAMGLAAGTLGFLFFWRGETRLIAFDKDRGVCRVESRRVGRKQATEHQISQIQDVELLNSYGPVGHKIGLNHKSGAISYLNDRVLPVSQQPQSEHLVGSIRQFLGLQPKEYSAEAETDEFSDEDVAVYGAETDPIDDSDRT